ncbi:site-specific integrase [Arthrobacter sp. efr-133-TYG-120]|uniref:site-specific integrase n=1 Tax=Arthrobacter sp. efr-133-TYG-120 TaxID=3040280 RepID=UPI00254EC9F1|nr:site-specific integrase [Arthrobacter sp. efr-133-TYG-120]
MARPPLPLGSWGKIKRTELAKGRWVAKARVRDLDGVTRLVERNGRTGAEAERNLSTHLADRTAPSVEDLTPESRLTALWEAYEAHLLEEGRAIRTMERYRYASTYVLKGLGGYKIREASTQRLDGFVKVLKNNHGPSVAKSARVILSGMFGLAVRFGAATTNPVRDVGTIKMESKPARALTVDELRGVIDALRNSDKVLNAENKVTPKQTISQYCAIADLTDVVIMFAATGARISEVLGIRWKDVDLTAQTVTISGKVNRVPGGGMIRESFTKTKSGARTLPLPDFAVSMLLGRQVAATSNIYDVIFPSTTGVLRDPSAVSKQWRRVRAALKLDWVTSHTYRKTVATLIDAQGLSARIGADQLGHAQVSMTQDVYMGRKVVHTEVAEALDQVMRQPGR